MDDHKYAYSNKFPIDPFKRDNVFKESNHLMQELQASLSQNMQRKFNIKNVVAQQKIEDFNVLNVIKTDHKTQQR